MKMSWSGPLKQKMIVAIDYQDRNLLSTGAESNNGFNTRRAVLGPEQVSCELHHAFSLKIQNPPHLEARTIAAIHELQEQAREKKYCSFIICHKMGK